MPPKRQADHDESSGEQEKKRAKTSHSTAARTIPWKTSKHQVAQPALTSKSGSTLSHIRPQPKPSNTPPGHDSRTPPSEPKAVTIINSTTLGGRDILTETMQEASLTPQGWLLSWEEDTLMEAEFTRSILQKQLKRRVAELEVGGLLVGREEEIKGLVEERKRLFHEYEQGMGSAMLFYRRMSEGQFWREFGEAWEKSLKWETVEERREAFQQND